MVFRERVDQLPQGRRGIADQRDFGLAQTRGFFAVGIDAHDLQIFIDAPRGERHEQPGADRQHRVGLAPQFAPERQRDAERIAAVEHAAATPIGQHGRLQQVGEQRHFGRGVLRAAAGDNQHALGFAEQLGGRAHFVLVDARLAFRQRRRKRHRRALAPDIDGAFERGRTWPALPHRRDRLGDFCGRFGRAIDAGGMIDQPRDDAGLVADLVQLAGAAADGGRRNLADQRQHRRIHAIGVEQRGAGIEQAGSRHHRVSLRLAGRQSRAERHIGRALLVPGVDHAQSVAGAVEGVEQVVVMHARQRVDGIEPMRDQRGRRGLAGGHVDGGRFGLDLAPSRIFGFRHRYSGSLWP